MAKAKPNWTLLIVSGPTFKDDYTFSLAMRQTLLVANIKHMLVRETDGVAEEARVWCRENRIPLTVFLYTEGILRIDDRPRLHAAILAERPTNLMLFDTAGGYEHLLDYMWEKGVGIDLCDSRGGTVRFPAFDPHKPIPRLREVVAETNARLKALRHMDPKKRRLADLTEQQREDRAARIRYDALEKSRDRTTRKQLLNAKRVSRTGRVRRRRTARLARGKK